MGLLWESGDLLGEVLGDANQPHETEGAGWLRACPLSGQPSGQAQGLSRLQGLSEADSGAPCLCLLFPYNHPCARGK